MPTDASLAEQSREALRLTRVIQQALAAGAPREHWAGFWAHRTRLIETLVAAEADWTEAIAAGIRRLIEESDALLEALRREREQARAGLEAVGETQRLQSAYGRRLPRRPTFVDRRG